MTAPSKAFRSPCASTATAVTRARPIISAAAVEAVRPGLRMAFERASFPATPPTSVAGQPRIEASGRARLGATMATPMKRAQTPTARTTRRWPVVIPLPNAAKTTSASATAHTTTATTGPKRANREGGSTEPSWTAAIGGTLVALSAGRRLASSVTITPRAIETITVRQANTSPVWGRSTPADLKSASSPLASARPTKRPTIEASGARDETLDDDDPADLAPGRARPRGGSRTRASAARS